jgi:phytoene synthase
MPPEFAARARTFAFAACFLPRRLRQPVHDLYAFARAIDDLVDEPPPFQHPHDTRAQLDAWRLWLAHPRPIDAAPDPRLAAPIAVLIDRHGLPVQCLLSLIDGVASDLYRDEMRSWPELRTYCLQVASSVGLAMCHLLGGGDDPLAREAATELGVAMQLTNILRDLGADLKAGRVYIPSDELRAHDFSREHLQSLADSVARRGPLALDTRFRSLMRAQIARARTHYERGFAGVRRLPPDTQFAILLAARLYAAILDEIERADYDVFTRRAATSAWFKTTHAARWWAANRTPRTPALVGSRQVVHP